MTAVPSDRVTNQGAALLDREAHDPDGAIEDQLWYRTRSPVRRRHAPARRDPGSSRQGRASLRPASPTGTAQRPAVGRPRRSPWRRRGPTLAPEPPAAAIRSPRRWSPALLSRNLALLASSPMSWPHPNRERGEAETSKVPGDGTVNRSAVDDECCDRDPRKQTIAQATRLHQSSTRLCPQTVTLTADTPWPSGQRAGTVSRLACSPSRRPLPERYLRTFLVYPSANSDLY